MFDQDDRNALMASHGLRIGLAQQCDDAGPTGVADPGLRAVDHQLVTLGACGGRHRLQVRAAAGFGERHRGPHLAARHARQVLLFLFLVAVQRDQLRHHGVPAHRAGQAHPAAGQLLGHLYVAGHRHRRTAVFLRHGKTEDPDPLHLLDPRFRVRVCVLDFAHSGLDVAVDEGPHRIDQHRLFIVECVCH